MKKRNPLLVPELRDLLRTQNHKALRDFCQANHPIFTAELISALDILEIKEILQHTDAKSSAKIFNELEEEIQLGIVNALDRKELARLFSELPPDDRVDLFKQLPETMQEIVLPALAQVEREDIRKLASYKEGTAGSVMTSDYATLPISLTALQAIDHLRKIAPDKETIYYAYVLNDERKILGLVSLKDLIVARKNTLVKDLMYTDIISAYVDEDQEEASHKIQKYNVLALPILNRENVLVGIITHDDAMDIITQENTEDIEKMMAIGGSHESAVYMKTSVWEHFKNRVPWVAILAILGFISGFIVQSFDTLLMQFTILAAFMPMLADTGGNTGSQSATMVIRALALKEISPRDLFNILSKEFLIALLLAVVLSSIAFIRVFFFSDSSSIAGHFSLVRVGVAISLALGFQVITSTLIGALLPLGATKMKLDPAVVASPALTTVVDISGLLIYFFTAKWMLGI